MGKKGKEYFQSSIHGLMENFAKNDDMTPKKKWRIKEK